MFAKKLVDVTAADILGLISDAVLENRTTEYKLELKQSKDSDKRELLADVSSFANAGGGDLLYGIAASDGIPVMAMGLVELNPDTAVLQLEAIIRTGIDPRIPGIQTHLVEGFERGPVLIVRIPRNWDSPHMVTY